MKTRALAVVCLLTILLSACATPPGKVVVVTPSPAAASNNPSPAQTEAQPTIDTAPSAEPTSTFLAASPSPADAPKMYTSYAHMVSFSPEAQTADFDYFDLLKGDDAVEWLVKKEGYSQADAQALVGEFADSEYIEKNTNSQLRTVNLSEVPVWLIINDDGTYTDDFEPRLADIDTLKTIYENKPSALLQSFFYKVEVDDGGAVESVSQVYWP